MTIAVTRNTPNRFNGYLCSCMQEIAPGVYVAPSLTKSVRERVWDTMMEWGELLPDDGGVVFLWRDPDAPSGLGVRFLGWPKKELVEYEGLWLTLGGLTAGHDVEELQRLAGLEPPTGDAVDPEVEDPTLETF